MRWSKRKEVKIVDRGNTQWTTNGFKMMRRRMDRGKKKAKEMNEERKETERAKRTLAIIEGEMLDGQQF